MKNILTKIEFHYTYLIMALGLVLTGHFSNLLVFTSLIIVHELGHASVASLFKIKIQKIIIYPYGGLTKLDSIVNSDINKDLLIASSGLLFQTIYYLIIYFLFREGIIREYIYHLFNLYQNSMLIFNLLPIVPLDGSKILNLLLSKYLNYNLSNHLTAFISLITIIFLLVSNMYEKNYSFIFVIGILLNNIYKFYYTLSYLYQRFLLERHLYHFPYKRHKIINDPHKMHKNKTHFFLYKNKIIPEKEYLDNFFSSKVVKNTKKY